jgi:hypothetical protein
MQDVKDLREIERGQFDGQKAATVAQTAKNGSDGAKLCLR